MFVAGIEFFFGLVAGLTLLIIVIVGVPKIGRSAVQFCKGQASTVTTVLWVLVIVCGATAIAAIFHAFQQ
jgi:hypothetical protein